MQKRWGLIRPSFSRAECLMLVILFGIIAAIVTATAISSFPGPSKEAFTKIEVDNLSTALNQYKVQYGEFPPDFSDPAIVEHHVRLRWPRIDWAEVATIRNLNLTPAQALVFWLRGFSPSPTHPYSTPGQRVAPLYDFDQTRLLDPATGHISANASVIPVYIPTAAGRTSNGTLLPYIYFDARTYSMATYAAPTGMKRPYLSDNAGDVYAAPDSFQIVHAGLDEDYGQVNATSNQASYPSGRNYAAGDFDNVTSFLKVGRTLDDAIP